MIVLNLFAGPGAGKSTTACLAFAMLKMKGVRCEYVPEYAKDLTWENRNLPAMQAQILGKQHWRIHRLMGSVDVAVTDSPVLLSSVYNNGRIVSLDYFAIDLHTTIGWENMNYYLVRTKKYAQYGRKQSENEAVELDGKVAKMLTDLKIEHHIVPGNKWGAKRIVKDVLERLKINCTVCSSAGCEGC